MIPKSHQKELQELADALVIKIQEMKHRGYIQKEVDSMKIESYGITVWVPFSKDMYK